MTRPLSIFIQADDALASVLSKIESVLGQAAERAVSDTGELNRFRMMDIEFALFAEHGLVDDRGIPFEKYRYELDLVALNIGSSVTGYDAMYESTAAYLAAKLSTLLICRTMVVENLQKIIATFGVEGTRERSVSAT